MRDYLTPLRHRSWLLTTDHKRIALLYLGSVTFFFFIGGLFATMIVSIFYASAPLVYAGNLQQALHMHGVAWSSFFLIPSIPAVPEFPDSAHDRRQGPGLSEDQSSSAGTSTSLAAVSFCFLRHRRAGHCWDLTHRSAACIRIPRSRPRSSASLSRFSSILTASTSSSPSTHARAGNDLVRLPLFVWAHYATSLVMVLGTHGHRHHAASAASSGCFI